MNLQQGDIVRSQAGHDKGNLYFILRKEGEFLWLADGKNRKIEAPKKKRQKHVVSAGLWTNPVTGLIQNGGPVLDIDIRKALAAFRDRFSEDQGGITLGEKRHD